MSAPTAADLLDKARKRLAELRAETEALEKLIEAYAEITSLRTVSDDSQDGQLSLYQGSSRRARQQRIADSVNAARHLMLTEGRPMKRGELVKKLLAQGYEIDGTDKNKVFGTNLWRSGKFLVIEGAGYWPKDAPPPRND